MKKEIFVGLVGGLLSLTSIVSAQTTRAHPGTASAPAAHNTAPLRDMRFVMHELHDSAGLAKLPGLEEVNAELLDTVLEEAAKFIGAVLLPLNAGGDAEGCHFEGGVVHTPKGFKDAYNAFVEAGWGSRLKSAA